MSSSTIRIEAPDATFRSLTALLRSSNPSAVAHLSLLSPASLSSSFTHYLATLPTKDAADFARTIVTSSAYWQGLSSAKDTVQVQPSTEADSTLSQAPSPQSSSLLSRSQLLFEATARAVLARIQVITHSSRGRIGPTSQKPLISWIRAVSEAVSVDAGAIPSSFQNIPVSSFALLTGIVAGLQAARAQKKQNQGKGLSTGYALNKAENEWCVAFAVTMETMQAVRLEGSEQRESVDEWETEFRKATTKAGIADPSTNTDFLNDPGISTLYLAAQVSTYVPAEKISSLPVERQLVSNLTHIMLEIFENCHIMESIREDISQSSSQLLTISAQSRTATRAASVLQHPLFPLFGPLSKLLSLAMSKVVRQMSPVQVQECLLIQDHSSMGPLIRMRRLAETWQRLWLGCRLAGAKEEDIEESSRSTTQDLWKVYKTLLFSFTMIFDALMEAIVEVCPAPTVTLPVPAEERQSSGWQADTYSNIPEAYLDTVTTILMTYANLSWITATFGSGAFDAYRRVFFEGLEVLSRDGRASVSLVSKLLPDDLHSEPQANAARRAMDTYLLDVAELVMSQLPDKMVKDVILPICRPYLDDRKYQDAFESAHSVVLSLFVTEKSYILELTPYYIGLLLASFPSNLSAEQLTFAFTTVMHAISDRSDTVAWHSLELLWSEIQRERYQAKESSDPSAAQQRGNSLRDVYIAQIPHVNLVLLRTTLANVKALIVNEQAGSPQRLHFCEQAFAALAGLDASTREEGVRWWLDERQGFGV